MATLTLSCQSQSCLLTVYSNTVIQVGCYRISTIWSEMFARNKILGFAVLEEFPFTSIFLILKDNNDCKESHSYRKVAMQLLTTMNIPVIDIHLKIPWLTFPSTMQLSIFEAKYEYL